MIKIKIKIRCGFVSNSSSSSFIIAAKKFPNSQQLYSVYKALCPNFFGNVDDIVFHIYSGLELVEPDEIKCSIFFNSEIINEAKKRNYQIWLGFAHYAMELDVSTKKFFLSFSGNLGDYYEINEGCENFDDNIEKNENFNFENRVNDFKNYLRDRNIINIDSMSSLDFFDQLAFIEATGLLDDKLLDNNEDEENE